MTRLSLLRELETPEARSGASTPQPQAQVKEPAGPNLLEVVLGNWWVKPWYPSFYPPELVGKKCESLYVCQWCFKYTKDLQAGYLAHMVFLSSLYTSSDTEYLLMCRSTGAMRLQKHNPNLRPSNLHPPLLHNPPARRRHAHALRAEPLPLRQALPRHKVRVLRRNHFPLLFIDLPRPRRAQRRTADCWVL